MSQASNEKKRGKLCLVRLENRRRTDYSDISGLCAEFASFGYYFDKTAGAAYDSPEEIVAALTDGSENYENLVVFCPKGMDGAVREFLGGVYSSQFSALGTVSDGQSDAFILFSDGGNRLRYEDIKDILDKKYGVKYDKSYIKCVGVPVKVMDETLDRAKALSSGCSVYFNVTDRYGDCTVEVVYSSQTPKMKLDEITRTLLAGLNHYVYALEDISLAEQLFRLLKLRRMKISVAESFTGGGVGKRLVEVPGVSEVYYEGLNTYSNSAKMQRLGVSELTLKQCGAVSAETAYKMAEGLLKSGNCDVAVSTTGIAGPRSDNTSKPVGLAYIGVGVGDDIAVYRFDFTGDRETITETAIVRALFLTYKKLK